MAATATRSRGRTPAKSKRRTAPAGLVIDFQVLRALRHPARIQMLEGLSQAGRDGISAKEFAAKLEMPLSNASYHLKELREAGMLRLVSETPRRGAVERHYAIGAKGVSALKVAVAVAAA